MNYEARINEVAEAARRAGWSESRIEKAQVCAEEWANATQNSNDPWNREEWENEAVTHFTDFTDDPDWQYPA